jgi:hypothetical protein
MGLVPYKRNPREISCPPSSMCRYNKKAATWKGTLTRTKPCCHPDLGLHRLQNSEKQIVVIYKPPHQGYYAELRQLLRG